MTSNLLNRFETLKEWLNGRVIGQQSLVNRLLLALLCGGHLIVEGAPGLAKTRVIKELAKGIEGDFHRIQFTPDLLPSDVTGTCLLYTSPSPRDLSTSRMPSSA